MYHINNFKTLIQDIPNVHLWIVPEESLKRESVDPNGNLVIQPNSHSNLDMMNILQNILFSTYCNCNCNCGTSSSNGDDDNDDDDRRRRSLTLQSYPSIYNQIIHENLYSATMTTSSNNNNRDKYQIHNSLYPGQSRY